MRPAVKTGLPMAGYQTSVDLDTDTVTLLAVSFEEAVDS